MKKIIAFFCIVIALIVFTIASEQFVTNTFDELETQLINTENILLTEEFDKAITASTACITLYKTYHPLLVYVMPNETLNLLEVSIYGMLRYSTEENRTEALAEAARAHAQLNAIRTLYFRII